MSKIKGGEELLKSSVKGTSLEGMYDKDSSTEQSADKSTVVLPEEKEKESKTVGEISQSLKEHESATSLPHPRGSVRLFHLETKLQEVLRLLYMKDGGLNINTTANIPNLTVPETANISDLTVTTLTVNENAVFSSGISTEGRDVYTHNGAFISHDNNGGAWSDRSGSNIDHMWHDDGNNAWHFVSDSAYKSTGNSQIYGGNIRSSGRIYVDNSNGSGAMGPANSGWFHFSTDRPNFYMNSGLHVNGDITTYNNDTFIADKSLGRVGIKRSTPKYTLDVNGTAMALDVTANRYVRGYNRIIGYVNSSSSCFQATKGRFFRASSGGYSNAPSASTTAYVIARRSSTHAVASINLRGYGWHEDWDSKAWS